MIDVIQWRHCRSGASVGIGPCLELLLLGISLVHTMQWDSGLALRLTARLERLLAGRLGAQYLGNLRQHPYIRQGSSTLFDIGSRYPVEVIHSREALFTEAGMWG